MTVRRLIACHDATQLVTALAVLATRERDGASTGTKSLLIHELWTGEEHALAATIRRIAERAGPWERIAFLDGDARAKLGGALRGRGLSDTLARVREAVGQQTVDELYLGREWQLGNRLLLAAYPEARRYCFGDGPGLYLSKRYHDPRSSPRARVLRATRDLAARVLAPSGYCLPPRARFDAGWFLAPDALGVPPMPTHRLPADILSSVVKGLAPASNRRFDDEDAAFLLTSNFSDWRMERGEELRAYVDFVSLRKLRPQTRLFIKPHPREPREKSEALRCLLAPLHPRTEILDEERFLPVELLYASVPGGAVPPVLTFGAAGLSLSLLFGAAVHLGFGATAVQRRFRSDHQCGRLQFEHDLRRVSAIFRAQSCDTMMSWDTPRAAPAYRSLPLASS